MNRTIRVTGKGNLSVKPDQIRLILSLTGTKMLYEDTVCMSSDETNALRACFKDLGFDVSDLKTTHFSIDTVYENYRDENNNYQSRFAGYRYTHHMKLSFDADNKLLGKVLSALSRCQVKPEFSIEYTVKDPEAAKNLLLARAVADARQKALQLADAAGVKAGEIVLIDYSFAEMEIVSRPMGRNMLCKAAANGADTLEMDIEPDDISLCDTVVVEWCIQS